jgi:D-alanyl-D-alanine carboxypeptidase
MAQMNKRAPIGTLILLIGAIVPAQAAGIDIFIKTEMQKRHIPGLSLAVVRRGKPVLIKGYGVANVEWSTPAAKDTVYPLHSMTKLFTGMAVMMLVEAGKLSLDDKIRKLLPELPSAWSEINVRHCLSETSGLPEILNNRPVLTRLLEQGFPERPDARAELLQRVAEDPMKVSPGEQWSYNQTAYILLQLVIEKVTGQSCATFVAERILQPLGMKATRFRHYAAINPLVFTFDIVKDWAPSYLWENNALKRIDFLKPAWWDAGAGLCSTAGDLAVWAAALSNDKLLKPSSREQLWTPIQLNSGKTYGYGLGWAVADYRGHRRAGWGGGNSSWLSHFPDDQLTVVALTNLEGDDPASLVEGVADFFLTPFGRT